MLKKVTFVLSILFLAGLVSVNAQTRSTVERDLIRLKSAIQRTESLIRILPEQNLKTSIEQNLQKVKDFRQKALDFQTQHKTAQAAANIQMAFQVLENIQKMVRSLPFFRLKFKERLDRKIQMADKRVTEGNQREALFMLNRAKYFREKAYLTIRQGRTFASLEYYRLAEFFADRAISFTEAKHPLTTGILEKRLLETQMLFHRAENNVNRNPQKRWKPILRRIRKELREARELLQQNRLTAANKKLLVINRALYRILDVSEGLPVPEQERLQLEFQALQSSFLELKRRPGFRQDAALEKLSRRTEMLLNRISNHIESHRLPAARKELLLANRMVFRLHRFSKARAGASLTDLSAMMDRTEKSLRQLQEGKASPIWDNVLQVAEFNLSQAQQFHQNNNDRKAIIYLQLANRIILKVSRVQEIKQNLDPATLTMELQRLNSLIQRMKNHADLTEKQTIQLKTAEKLAVIARKAFEAENYYYAQSLIKISINLITK